MNRKAYLIFVAADANHNKYYQMEEVPGGIAVEWGRVGADNPQTKTYRPGEKSWDGLLSSKTRKGYKDITALKNVVNTPAFVKMANSGHQKFFEWLQSKARGFVKQTYIAELGDITPAQVEHAQHLLDNLRQLVNSQKPLFIIQKQFEAIWSTIPRKMKNVRDELPTTLAAAQAKIESEQRTLDILAAQVATYSPSGQQQTLASTLGLTVVDLTPADRTAVAKAIGGDGSYITDHAGRRRAKVVDIIKVEAHNRPAFLSFVKARPAKQQTTRLLWHGSRNENWWNILKTGLILRPNATITGKLFGYGLYFAEDSMKSLGYTDLDGIGRWVSGSDRQAVLALFEVHTGWELRLGPGEKTDRLENWIQTLTEQGLKKVHDYDSLNARKGFNYGGSSLLNSEQIVYNENQTTVRFLVIVEPVK